MQEKKQWYEKLNVWLGIIASLATISGISIYTLVKMAEENGYVNITEPEQIIYNNTIWFSVECASVLAMNADKEYVPVSYSPIDINNTMTCTLINKENTYEGIKEDNYFKFYNVVPGEYEIIFLDSFYMYDKSFIGISEDTEAKSTIHITMPELYYSKYKISYKTVNNTYYEFRDDSCSYKIIDDTFLTDENGTFNFLVNWDSEEIDINIHAVKGGHITVLMGEQYNNANFIN